MMRRAICTLFLILATGLDGNPAHAADNPQLKALFERSDGGVPDQRMLKIGRLDLSVELAGGTAQTRATVHFENPERAPFVVLFADHRLPRYLFFLACSSRCFLTSSSASAAGSGA